MISQGRPPVSVKVEPLARKATERLSRYSAHAAASSSFTTVVMGSSGTTRKEKRSSAQTSLAGKVSGLPSTCASARLGREAGTERGGHPGRGRATRLGCLGQRTIDDGLEGGGNLGVDLPQGRMRLAGDAVHDVEGRIVLVARERRAPGEHLVQHHAEAEDVGARLDRLARHLLG